MQNLPRQVIRAVTAALLLCAGAAPAAPEILPGSRPKDAAPKRTFTAWDQTPPPSPPVTPEFIEAGERVFKGACLGCHGEKADGQGREGKLLKIPPRDFTQGAFLCRTTASGSLPLDTDLFRSIRHGFKPQIGMPSFQFLSDREVWQVVSYLKTRSERWKTEQVPPPMEIPPAPARTAELIKAGEAVFKATGCAMCHGEKGLADGPSAPMLNYDNGLPVPPANFTKPMDFKCGSRREDIFRTISTGMDGSPMPTFADSLTVEQRWQIVYFVQALGEQAAVAANK